MSTTCSVITILNCSIDFCYVPIDKVLDLESNVGRIEVNIVYKGLKCSFHIS